MCSSKLKAGLCFIGLVLIVWWYFYFQLFVFTYLSTISCWQISNSWMVSQETDSYHSWPDSLCTEDQYNLTGVSSLAFVVHSWPCWQLVFIKLSDMASLAAPSLLPALRCTIYLTLTLYCFFVCNEQVRCVDKCHFEIWQWQADTRTIKNFNK